jgi:hypothetical protein
VLYAVRHDNLYSGAVQTFVLLPMLHCPYEDGR